MMPTSYSKDSRPTPIRYIYSGVGLVFLLFIFYLGFQTWQRQVQARQLATWLEDLPDMLDPQKGYEIAEKARLLAAQLGRENETGKAYYYMALYAHDQDRFAGFYSENASLLASGSQRLFTETKDAFWLAKSILLCDQIDALDTTHFRTNITKLDSLLPYMQPMETLDIEARILKSRGLRMGKDYWSINDSILKANQCLLEAATVFHQIGQDREAAICYRNAGAHHQDLIYNTIEAERFEEGKALAQSGIKLLQQARNLFETQRDTFGVAHVLHRLGRLYTDFFILSLEPMHLDTAMGFFQQNLTPPYTFHEESTYEAIGTIYSRRFIELADRKADQDSALVYFDKSARLSIERTNLIQLQATLAQWEFDLQNHFNVKDSVFFNQLIKYKPLIQRDEAIQNMSRQATQINEQTLRKMNEFDLAAARLEARRKQRNTVIWGGGMLILIIFIFVLLYQRSRLQALQQELDLSLKLAQTKMNPHFIGNTLNSIDSLINNDNLVDGKEMASEYLVKFSRLAESILRNSDRTHISLQQEVETLKNYIELERLRLNNKFDYELDISTELPLFSIQLPPMMIQPLVENAIWHGLQHRIHGYKEHGYLIIKFLPDPSSTSSIFCEVTDNGIGRVKARELQGRNNPEANRSHATEILGDRLNRAGFTAIESMNIIDLYDPYGKAIGTKVELKIPVYDKK